MMKQTHGSCLYDRMTTELGLIFLDKTLRCPVFYNARTGLRFEIGTGNTYDKNTRNRPRTAYVHNALERALKLFHACFPTGPDLLLLNFLSTTEVRTTALLEAYSNSNLFGKVDEVVCGPNEEEGMQISLFFDVQKTELNIAEILQRVILSDFMSDYKEFGQSVFFFDCSRHLLFHLYDDRGLDVVSPTSENLRKLYTDYNSWILDYDRERINQFFKLPY